MFSLLLFCVFSEYSNSKQIEGKAMYRKLQSYKSQSKIFAYSGLASLCVQEFQNSCHLVKIRL